MYLVKLAGVIGLCVLLNIGPVGALFLFGVLEISHRLLLKSQVCCP